MVTTRRMAPFSLEQVRHVHVLAHVHTFTACRHWAPR
jgi:hypothetical protein